MNHVCEKIGPSRCRTVKYEDLVSDTEKEMKSLLQWLGLPWEQDMLRHHEVLDSVQTSKLETTADQIDKPIYLDSVDHWKGNIPQDILDDNLKYGSALRQFGYTLFD